MKFFTAKLKSSADFYAQIALVLVIVLLVNIIFAIAPWRFDVTEARIYSVSSVTKQSLHELDDIVTIKAFFTEDLPGYLITVRQQVKDILAEYKNYGGGNVRVKFYNPNKDAELEQEAQSLGIPPIQFNVVEKDKFEVAQGYLGIAVLYGSKVETIPVIQDTTTLEYDLTAAIKKVILGKDLTVGILQKEGSLMSQPELNVVQQVLSKQYNTVFINLEGGALIGDNIDTLIVPGPVGEFSDRELYIIDQFVMSGRGVFVAVDGIKVEEGLVAAPNDSNLLGLLKSYGVTINKDLIYDPRYNGQASFSQGFMQFFTPYGFWPRVVSGGFNPESMLVNKLESLYLPWGSSLTFDEKEGNSDLARTSPDSSVAKEPFDLSPQGSPQTTGGGNFIVVVSIQSELNSFFDQAIAADASVEDEVDTPENYLTGTDAARLVVISEAELLSENFIRRFEENLIFVQNIVDGLTLDESLAAIRSKAVSSRPVSELDDTARSLVKYGNMVGVPILVILFAIVHFVWRRKSQSVGSQI